MSSIFTFCDGKLEGGLLQSNYRIDPTKTPKEIDFTLTSRKRPHSFDRERHKDEGWSTIVYENVSEKIDPDVASLIGEWVPQKATNVPFRFIDEIVFYEQRKFENTVSVQILGWPQRKLGDPQELANVRMQIDSSKKPPQLTAYLTTKSGRQQINFEFTGTHEIKKDQLRIIMISDGKRQLVRGVPIRNSPVQWYFELKKLCPYPLFSAIHASCS